jgi:hypothetical protein
MTTGIDIAAAAFGYQPIDSQDDYDAQPDLAVTWDTSMKPGDFQGWGYHQKQAHGAPQPLLGACRWQLHCRGEAHPRRVLRSPLHGRARGDDLRQHGADTSGRCC